MSKKDDKQHAGITPGTEDTEMESEVRPEDIISFYDTELGGFLAKGMDDFLKGFNDIDEKKYISLNKSIQLYQENKDKPFVEKEKLHC